MKETKIKFMDIGGEKRYLPTGRVVMEDSGPIYKRGYGKREEDLPMDEVSVRRRRKEAAAHTEELAQIETKWKERVDAKIAERTGAKDRALDEAEALFEVREQLGEAQGAAPSKKLLEFNRSGRTVDIRRDAPGTQAAKQFKKRDNSRRELFA